MADLRIKWGRNMVEPGLQEMMPKHNMRFCPFFTVEEKKFLDSDEKTVPKNLFFCHDPAALVEEIKQLRGILEDTENLVQGDTGQGWLKIGLNVVMKKD